MPTTGQSGPAVNPSGAPADYLGHTMSVDGGATWESSSVLCALKIHGTLLPEPASLCLLLAGGLAMIRRRRR